MIKYPVRLEEAQKHLESKYHEKFIPDHGLGIGLDSAYAEAIFVPERFPGELVRVIDQGWRMLDDYYRLIAREPCRQMLDRAFDVPGRQLKVFFRFISASYPDRWTKAEQFPEALKTDPEFFTANITVLIREDEAFGQADWDLACQRMREMGLSGLCTAWRIDGALFADVETRNFRESMDQIAMNSPCFVTRVPVPERGELHGAD